MAVDQNEKALQKRKVEEAAKAQERGSKLPMTRGKARAGGDQKEASIVIDEARAEADAIILQAKRDASRITDLARQVCLVFCLCVLCIYRMLFLFLCACVCIVCLCKTRNQPPFLAAVKPSSTSTPAHETGSGEDSGSCHATGPKRKIQFEFVAHCENQRCPQKIAAAT